MIIPSKCVRWLQGHGSAGLTPHPTRRTETENTFSLWRVLNSRGNPAALEINREIPFLALKEPKFNFLLFWKPSKKPWHFCHFTIFPQAGRKYLSYTELHLFTSGQQFYTSVQVVVKNIFFRVIKWLLTFSLSFSAFSGSGGFLEGLCQSAFSLDFQSVWWPSSEFYIFKPSISKHDHYLDTQIHGYT